jgi:hypothetical protein
MPNLRWKGNGQRPINMEAITAVNECWGRELQRPAKRPKRGQRFMLRNIRLPFSAV